jgi:ribose transport system ATP-binding protein
VEVRIGPIPVAFVVAVGLAIVLEYLLRRSRRGRSLRAAGSNEKAAHRLGVPVSATVVLAYVAAGFFVFLAGVMLMAQIGVGDPAQGVDYTLWSVTAVVLGGASLFGARGSFIGVLLGAFLIQQILNATVFLRLNQEWQFWLLGLLTLAAAGIYSQARRVRDAT